MQERLSHVLVERRNPKDELRQVLEKLGGSESAVNFIAEKAVDISVEGKFPWSEKRVIFGIPGNKILAEGRRLRFVLEKGQLTIVSVVRKEDGWGTLDSVVLSGVDEIKVYPLGGKEVAVDWMYASFRRRSY